MTTRIATTPPPGVIGYRQTPEFTRATVPDALPATHSVKAGKWGLLRVLRGRVRNCLDDGSTIRGEFHRAKALP